MGGITQGRVQTGNAVPVFVAKALSEQLKKMFQGKKLMGCKGNLIQEDLF
jgi:site-specific DNA-cytosine methylase